MPTAHTLSDLRARRLARRLIELEDQLGELGLGCAPCADVDRVAIARERDRVFARLARAVERLERACPLRRAIEDAIAAAGSAPETIASALIAVRDAMRGSSPPPVRA